MTLPMPPTCPQRKVVFLSEREARRQAKWSSDKTGSKLSVYRCRYCKRWHLTSWGR